MFHFFSNSFYILETVVKKSHTDCYDHVLRVSQMSPASIIEIGYICDKALHSLPVSYTHSDAADDLTRVDLGGRRII